MKEKLNKILDFYSEAVDEIMGSESYLKAAKKAKESGEKEMYLTMAQQELGHAGNLNQMAEHEAEGDETLKIVWEKLSAHLCDWKKNVAAKIESARG